MDGFINRAEFDRAVGAGAIFVEKESPQDMWLDSVGRAVWDNSPDAPSSPPESLLARAAASVSVAAPGMRPVQPEGSAWTPGGRTRGNIDLDPKVDKSFGGWMMEGILYRLGLSSFWDSDGQSDVGLYYYSKNNQLNKHFAHMRNVWVFVGLFVLMMLVVVPVWNACRLLQDPAYIYFAGKVVPRGILSVCLSLPIFYVCTISLLFKRAALKVINEQTLLGVGLLFLTTLGFSLVLFSFPLQSAATSTYQDLVVNCQVGPRTRELYQTSQALQVLRSDVPCSAELTVATCTGFQMTPYTEVLQAMEESYKCSGFCYNQAAVQAAAEPPQAADAASLLQISQSSSHRRAYRRQRSSSVDAASSKLDAEAAALSPTAHDAWPADDVLEAGWAGGTNDAGTKWASGQPSGVAIPAQVASDAGDSVLSPYPGMPPLGLNATEVLPYAPTLFSNLNWKASCDGMTANAMLHGAGDVALASFYQGLLLMLMSIIVGFMQLLGMCYVPKYRS